MRKIFALVIMLALAPAFAKVYKHVDESGNIVFSDKEMENSEEIQLPDFQTYEAQEYKSVKLLSDKESEQQAFGGYDSLVIINPNNGVHLPPGTEYLIVKATSSPRLQRNHTAQLLINGAVKAEANDPELLFELAALDRGEHKLMVQIVDKNGKVVKGGQSAEIKIFQFRPSVNFPAPAR